VASAGAGKTWRLSSRIIELLAAGAPPEEIFASTFTRKAAGEILERVLLRLARGALDETAAAQIDLTREQALELLESVVRRLHALQVGTLDSFFQRVARAFSLDLGLPPGWTLAEGPAEDRLRSEAVTRLLGEIDRGALTELLRQLHGGDAKTGVHELLLREMGDLHRIYLDLDPAVSDPWGFAGGGAFKGSPVTPEELVRLADRLADAPLPQTAAGLPDARWASARQTALEELRSGDLEGFVSGGLGAACLGSGTYYRKPIPDEMYLLLDEGVELARRSLGALFQSRARALGRLAPIWDGWLHRLRVREGRYGFDDITRLISGGWGSGGLGALGAELHYRLDARVRHILLDEFQDTSIGQWRALRPLVHEILSGYEGERGAVIVADPKQSIYGWRGGEPRILDAVRRDFPGLARESLDRSWRSSPVVLDLVNRVFGELVGLDCVPEECRDSVTGWLEGFNRHEAQHTEFPGYVRVAGGQGGDPPRASVRPRLLAGAAVRVQELHARTPAATIGVLMRTNASVARMMGELRRLGLDASEEGGVPVADSPAVLALLALLRIADHPGDRVARYHAAHTPAARLLPASFDWASEGTAERLSRELRRRLVLEGYGPVVSGWARRLAPEAGARDRRRLRQLSSLAFRWDALASLRPAEFVRWVQAERVEDPGAARIRVMTVHQAKGLEFDIVVLPDLDTSIKGRGGSGVLAFRPEPDGPVTRVFPRIGRPLRPLFPEVEAAVAREVDAAVRDGLSGLYVALTRARFSVEVILRPDGASASAAFSGANVVRQALGIKDLIVENSVFAEFGDASWFQAPGAPSRLSTPVPYRQPQSPGGQGVPAEPGPEPVPLLRRPPGTPRRRLLPRRTPSQLEGSDDDGGVRVRLEHLLRDGGAEARARGSVAHAWLEAVEWIEEGLPGDGKLLEMARRTAPELRSPADLLADVRHWLGAPEVRRALSRRSWGPGASVVRERPFVVRDGDRILQGIVDRMVIEPGAGGDGGPRISIFDFKTDSIPAGDDAALGAAVEHYRPQLEAYRRAMSREEGVPAGRIELALVFLVPGRVVTL